MKKILIPLVFISFAAICLSYITDARSQNMPLMAREATILYLQGDVTVQTQRSIKWIDATIGMKLKQGDSLKTGPRSWAEIEVDINYENVVRVREKTLVKIVDLRPVRISLLKGEVRSLVEGLSEGSTFQIETPTAVCGARGTGWDTQTDGTKVIVDAYEDRVYFSTMSKISEEIIKEGKRGVLEDPQKAITIRDIPIERIRRWNRWKEDLAKRRSVKKDVVDKRAKQAAAPLAVEPSKADVEEVTEEGSEELDTLQKAGREVDKENVLGDIRQKVKRIERIERRRRSVRDIVGEAREERSSGGDDSSDEPIDRRQPPVTNP